MQKPAPLSRYLMWAATLSLGFGTLWPIVIAWLGSSTQTAGGKRVMIRRDGSAFVVEYEDGNYYTPIYHDLDGEVVTVSPREKFSNPINLSNGVDEADPFALGWSTRLKAFSGVQSKLVWYFVHDGHPNGTGYFEGFLRKSRAPVGFIGTAGFSPQLPTKDQRFSVRTDLLSETWSVAQAYPTGRGFGFTNPNPDTDQLRSLVFVPTGDKVLAVDLEDRTVRPFFEASERIRSISISAGAGDPDQTAARENVIVRTSSKIDVLSAEGKQTTSVTISPEMKAASYFTWYEVDGGKSVIVANRISSDGRHTPVDIYNIDPDGTIEAKRETTLDSGVDPTNPKLGALLVSTFVPAPALLAFGVLVIVPLFEVSNGDERSYAEAALSYANDGWPAFTFILVISLLLAAWGRRRATMYELSDREKWAWTIYIVLLGIPGFVGYLLHRAWPVREKCPSCVAKPPRDRDGCASCGTPFPEPALKGTEIFV